MDFTTIVKTLFAATVLGANIDAGRNKQPYIDISKSEIKSIVGVTNKLRSRVKVPAVRMHKVSWNYAMASDLQQDMQTRDKSWWFSKDQDKARYNGQVLMDFEPFKSKYPGWDFLIHDGCQSNGKGVRRIFSYRARQARFFDYSNCNTTGFTPHNGYINSYMSCNAADFALVSNKPYSWVWQYVPKLLLENTTEIACMLTGFKGPNAAGGYRPNHFFCYRNNASPQINEQPYKAGRSMSECPISTKRRKGLCV